MLTVLLKVHLVEAIFQVQQGEQNIALLVGQLVFDDGEGEVFALKLGIKPAIVND